eukprot:jgi/Bigna1/44460/e_gw1.96.25.1
MLYSWGAGYHGQLGLEAKRKKCEMIPVQINFNEAVIQISCGGFHTGLLTEQGKVYTWGDGEKGQLGNLDAKDRMHATPHLVEDLDTKWIAAGATATSCVTVEGEMWLWGFGESFHPKGTSNIVYKPVKVKHFVDKGETVVQVGIGQSHIVVLTEGGDVWAFGK